MASQYSLLRVTCKKNNEFIQVGQEAKGGKGGKNVGKEEKGGKRGNVSWQAKLVGSPPVLNRHLCSNAAGEAKLPLGSSAGFLSAMLLCSSRRLLGRVTVQCCCGLGQRKTEFTVVVCGLYMLSRAQPLPPVPPNQPMRVQY